MKKIDKDVVCLMPWIHMHIWPNGNTFPCCMSDTDYVFGNVHKESINELANNENFKTIRKEMLNGIKPKACTRCYELETSADSWTLRKNSLESFKNHLDLFEKTNEDGSINDYKMFYMDIRFSNLCNMKCRTCGPELSSSWYDDQVKLHPDYPKSKFIDLKHNPFFMDDLKPHLDYVEEVYFAGGEALITPQHYQVLDYWLEKGRTDVRLRYTTNFSALKLKEKSILEYWKMFKDVRVAASLDTYGDRAEYSRKGTDWERIVKNRRQMIESCPDVYFEITPTVSIFSIYSLFDFHRTWVEEGLLNINNIRVNILTHPRYFSATMLPEEQKSEVRKIYIEYIDWLKSNNAWPHIIHSVKGIVDYMDSADHTDLLPEFRRQINKIDEIRNENILDVFPELRPIWT